MTFEEIDKLEAGHKLNGLIAKHIFGCEMQMINGDACCACDQVNEKSPHASREAYSGTWIIDYSTDIAAAWLVVEHFARLDGIFVSARPQDQDWWTVIPDEKNHPKGSLKCGPGCSVMAFGPTAPLSICRAALRMVMKGGKNKS